MSDSKTIDVINAMADHAEAHDWQYITPVVIFRGPIPPGNITFPCLSICAVGGLEANSPGYNRASIRENFRWTIAQHLGLGDVVEQYQTHMKWRDEMRGIVRRAIDQYWGMGGTVTLVNINPTWESDFFQLGDGDQPMASLVATSLMTEVEYREQF